MLPDGAPAGPDSPRRGFRLGEWRVDPGTDRLTGEGGTVHLRPRVMDLLVFLAGRCGEVVAKAELLDAVWSTRFVAESALSSAIAEARRALGDRPGSPRYLETIPKRGYRLLVRTAPLSVAGPNAARRDVPGVARPWPVGPDAVFVGREPELARLEEALLDACSGRGSAVFVTGEPGSGKTALLAAFAGRALAASPGVAVAGGRCPIPVIPVESCLPFREALAAIGGEPLRGWLPASAGGAAVGWSRDLAGALAERPAAFPAAILDPAAAGPAPDQTSVVAQLESVLLSFSSRRPLLLLVDDLHRADRGSVALLARLARELPRSRILLVASYRPGEAPRDAGRTRKERAVDEVVRSIGGAAFVRLGQAPDRAFVDALVDAVPNALGVEFRDALFEHSDGLPVVAVEILRSLCAKGVLAAGRDGRWAVVGPVDWREVPERVARLLREQLDALGPFERRVLTAAALEGEEFAPESVAATLGEPLPKVVEAISAALGRQRRLVEASGASSSGEGRVAPYRFRHALLRRWIHDGLDEVELRLWRERANAAGSRSAGGRRAAIRAIIPARRTHDGALRRGAGAA